MWLGSGVAVAVASVAAPIPPLAWELPYVAGAATKRKKKIEKYTLYKSDFSNSSVAEFFPIDENWGCIFLLCRKKLKFCPLPW